jgi:hypothetical protein
MTFMAIDEQKFPPMTGPGSGSHEYRLADGSVMKSPRFFLQEVKVGNHSFNHILASVSPFESKPLLGQSFLSKVGAWSINNDRHVLVLQSHVTEPTRRATNRPPFCSLDVLTDFGPMGLELARPAQPVASRGVGSSRIQYTHLRYLHAPAGGIDPP